jgi:hypothetical protein
MGDCRRRVIGIAEKLGCVLFVHTGTPGEYVVDVWSPQGYKLSANNCHCQVSTGDTAAEAWADALETLTFGDVIFPCDEGPECDACHEERVWNTVNWNC